MIDELDDPFMLCPNTKQIDIEGNEYFGSSYFSVYVEPTEHGAKLDVLNNTIIFTGAMTRYFEPEEYNDQGFSTPIIKSV